jgi:hypothetical protein
MGHLVARDLQRNKYIMQQQHIKAIMCHDSRVPMQLNLGALLCPAGYNLETTDSEDIQGIPEGMNQTIGECSLG